MKKIILALTALFFVMSQFAISQNEFSRISISTTTPQIQYLLVQRGLDLRCGVSHNHENHSISIDISNDDRRILDDLGVAYTVEIDDVQTFYNERAVNNLPRARMEAQIERALTASARSVQLQQRGSISSEVKDNYLQYDELNEKDWATPVNFELGSMGGCYTISEVESELDDMRTYSQTNSLDIVSVKQDASPTSQTTWGNPASTITNNGLTYSGQGGTRWDPRTIYYVRITGSESTTPEGTRPQMLFTSMIHSREVSALMNNMFFMWYIIENYNTDPAIKELVDNNELYFVPVVNPDGLRWNEHVNSSGGAMQRKNLRPNTGGTGNTDVNRGVDLNRNFDYFWGSAGTGSSGTPTSDTYRGPSPASEPETQIMVDFILARNFKTGIWNHSFANSIPHPYGGNPSFVSGREDEMHEMHENMTKYNRYVSGATIFPTANGIADDWMLGGSADGNGSTGSGQNILATTPEHGGVWFWPDPSTIIPIAKQSIRISLMGAYHGGKYAKFHDLTQSDITSLSANLDFAIERIGQTASDFTLTVTPVSANITNIVSPATQSGMSILEQRNVTASMTLDPSIQPNDLIEYKIELSNGDSVFYEVNIEKYYQPTVLFSHNPDTDGLTGWTNSGWNNTTVDAYSGSNSLRTGNYANSATETLTTSNSYDLSGSTEVLVQFYTKWDIERNFDFVELQASTNGTTWVNLNGKYTKPESSASTNDHILKSATNEAFQGNNASGHIYDGDRMDKWVMEEILIDGTNNSTFINASSVSFRFRLQSDSNNQFENYSANREGFYFDDFKIISIQVPCVTSVPTGLAVNAITASTAYASWDNIPLATYDIRYRATSTATWTEVTDLTSANYSITGLDATTDYEVQVRSRCTSTTSAYNVSVNFTTTDLTYCTASGANINDEYIGGVTLNSILNDTSSSTTSGYSDFTGSNIFDPIQIGSTGNSISVSKFWNTTYNEAVSVWIDFNKNGTFEGSEKILEDGANQDSPVTDTFTVPVSASSGVTRMRVLMKYHSATGTIQNDPCEDFQYGEVEDYRIYLYDGLLYTGNTWYPNAPNTTTGSENALILDGIYNANVNISINNITVSSGAEINVNKANAVTINGNIVNNGLFVLNSDSDEFSSLMVDGTISGDIDYNRHVNSNAGGNDLIAPPVSGQTFVDFLSNNTNIFANPAETLYLFGPFEKPANDYTLFANTETATLNSGTGYRAASTDNGTFEFSGAVSTGNVDIPILKTGANYDKWNLIGNPYTTYISLADFLTANLSKLDQFSAAVYGLNADSTNGSIWTIWNLAYSDANPGTLIAPGQGFFVSSKDGGANISFTPSMRAIGTSDDFIAGRNGSNTIEHSILRMTTASNSFETEIYFNDNTSLGLDVGYDAEHFGGAPSDFSIYSQLAENNQGLDMAIQAISASDIEASTVIPLGVNATQGQQIVISLEANNLSQDIYLEDAIANTFTLLNTFDYSFTPSSDLTGIGRFYIWFNPSTLSSDDLELDRVQIYTDSELEQVVVKGLLNQETTLRLYDIQGREILKKELTLNTLRNNVRILGLTNGVYIVQLNNGIKIIAKKLIVK